MSLSEVLYMKKKIYKDLQLVVAESCNINPSLSLLRLKSDIELPLINPGQFVNILPPTRSGVLLRRPISICNVTNENREIWVLVKDLGRGSHALCECKPGEILQMEIPLGNGFSISGMQDKRALLIGGGVGIAPLLYLGRCLKTSGGKPEFLLGGRISADLPLLEEFSKYGAVHIATEDGSKGEFGFVTDHSCFKAHYDMIYCCGPLQMMKAVSKSAFQRGIECEVSLENKMACGIGACLCCVENTIEGNKCTCTHGPVFNIKQLQWNK